MFKKVLLRSLAGATAAGSALTVSLMAGPATVSSAPAIRNVDCYPGSVSTSTNVWVKPAIGAYGTAARAKAKVSGGNPRGSVEFTLGRHSWTARLSHGYASVSLPRWLPAGRTYTVHGSYHPRSECYKGSSDSANYTVMRAGTRTQVGAPDVKRGHHAYVSVSVHARTGTPSGKVRISVVRHGHTLATVYRTLSHGHASATLGEYRVGSYTAEASYLGTGNWKPSSDSEGFRVHR